MMLENKISIEDLPSPLSEVIQYTSIKNDSVFYVGMLFKITTLFGPKFQLLQFDTNREIQRTPWEDL